MKICSNCEQTLPETEFYKRKLSKDGLGQFDLYGLAFNFRRKKMTEEQKEVFERLLSACKEAHEIIKMQIGMSCFACEQAIPLGDKMLKELGESK